MTHFQRLSTVRTLLAQWFAKNIEGEIPCMTETLLISGGHYRGRRFVTQNHWAIWFAEEDELKVYACDGRFVTSMSVAEPGSESIRAAA